MYYPQKITKKNYITSVLCSYFFLIVFKISSAFLYKSSSVESLFIIQWHCDKYLSNFEDEFNFNKTTDIENIEIEICGLCTDICVISNAILLKNAFPNNDIVINSKCCAGTTPEAHKAALAVMKNCQIEVV